MDANDSKRISDTYIYRNIQMTLLSKQSYQTQFQWEFFVIKSNISMKFCVSSQATSHDYIYKYVYFTMKGITLLLSLCI